MVLLCFPFVNLLVPGQSLMFWRNTQNLFFTNKNLFCIDLYVNCGTSLCVSVLFPVNLHKIMFNDKMITCNRSITFNYLDTSLNTSCILLLKLLYILSNSLQISGHLDLNSSSNLSTLRLIDGVFLHVLPCLQRTSDTFL